MFHSTAAQAYSSPTESSSIFKIGRDFTFEIFFEKW